MTPSRSQEREWEFVHGRVRGVKCGPERGHKWQRRDSEEDESIVEPSQPTKRARTLDEESVVSGVGGEEEN